MGKSKARTERRTKYDKRSRKFLREGEGNRQKILNVVTDYTNRKERGGIQPSEIADILGMTRQTVQGHLRLLTREREVEKRNDKGHRREYRVTDSYLVGKRGFAFVMKPMGKKMIDTIRFKYNDLIEGRKHLRTYDNVVETERKRDLLPLNKAKDNKIVVPKGVWHTFGDMVETDVHEKYPSWYFSKTRPENKFLESMRRGDVTISNDFCQTKFSRAQMKEKYIFEFGNRVAAFIEYIFIECLKAREGNLTGDNIIDTNKIYDYDNNAITKIIIENAIDLNRFFKDFQMLFRGESVKEVSEAFKRVYPAGKKLEKYWSDHVELARKLKRNEKVSK